MALRNDWATGDWFGASDQNDVANAVNLKVDAFANGTATSLALDTMTETQWAATTPVTGRVYLVFED